MRKIRTKLTSVDVADIRRAYELGATQRELCLRYNMSIGQIGRIVRGESWTRVQAMPTQDEMEALSNRIAAAQRGKYEGLVPVAEAAFPVLPKSDIPVSQSVADRAAAFGAHVLPPVSPMDGGDVELDETEGSGFNKLLTTKGDEDGRE